MSVFEHSRFRIFNRSQHPLKHDLSEFLYNNPALPTTIVNFKQTMDYVFAVLYPQTKPSVATTALLPTTGNTVNDMRVVQDDGDGKAASYRWEQREGEIAASWHKIYDLDFGLDGILQAWNLKTQDIYVIRQGYNDLDGAGVAVGGDLAGQTIFGGSAAGTHLTLFANSGDGVGADTGFVQFGDQVRPLTDSAISLGTTGNRWLKIWTDEITVGTMTLTGGSIADSSGAITFGALNLSTTGWIRVDAGLKDANVATPILIGDAGNTAFSGTIIPVGTSLLGGFSLLEESISRCLDTGFYSWGAGTTYYTVTGGKLQVDRAGVGYIKGKKVTWVGGQQTAALAPNTLTYVYIDTAGTIGATTSRGSLSSDAIILFEVLYDGTNYVVVRENHPYGFQSTVSEFLHNNVGPVIRSTGSVIARVALGTGAAAGDRQVKIVGDDVLEDHGLTTTISDSAGAGVTWNVYYTNASGKWIRYAAVSELPMYYNSTGTPTALGTGPLSDTGVFTLYVSKDDLNTATPTYYAVMNTAVYNTGTLATTAVSAGSVAPATNELAGLELAQLGYAVVANNGTGGQVLNVIVSKSTFNSKLVGGGTIGSASLISTLTSEFTGWLSATDTTVQVALDTLDNLKFSLPVDNLLLDGNTISSTDTNGNIILDPNGTGLIEFGSAFYPTTDSTWDIGKTGNVWNRLWIDGDIGFGTTFITVATLLSFSEALTGASTGMALFYNSVTGKWEASAPDTEIDHSALSGITTTDAGHTQFAMLAGRSGGQTLIGSTVASQHLTLQSTSDVTRGNVIFVDILRPSTDKLIDVGTSAYMIKDLYQYGQLIGSCLQNATTVGRPAASASTIGRMVWDTDLQDFLVDGGGYWLTVGVDRWTLQDASTWEGTCKTVTYTVDGSVTPARGRVSDARLCIWMLKDNTNSFKQILCDITATATTVTVTVDVALPAGTYTLVGIG